MYMSPTKPLRRCLPILAGMLLSLPVAAADIAVGAQLSPLAITDLGECILEGGDTAFRPWSSKALAGEVQVLEYTAARAGVDKVHAAFFLALAAAGFPAGEVQVTKLVNSDDALWGTSGLVAGEIEKNKRASPGTAFVVDAQGIGRQQWQLQGKTAALAVLDPTGRVLYFSEGEMSPAETAAAIEAIRAALASAPPESGPH